jgi:transcriptional regulator with XRE-family HTH domain
MRAGRPSPPPPPPELHGLGTRIRRVRRQRGITLERLSRDTGLSRSYLSRIENGRKTPPLETLQRLAEALQVAVAVLLEDDAGEPADDQPFFALVRATPRPDEARTPGGPGVEYRRLTRLPAANRMEPLLLTLAADAQAPVLLEDEREQFLYVLSGDVEWRIASQVHLLHPGDSVHLEAGLAHRVRALNGMAMIVLVLSPET